MSRISWLLTALVAVLIAVVWFFLLWSPTAEDIDDVRAETERVEQQTRDAEQRAARLRAIRDSAPEAAADLARADVLIPREPALPSLLRQLQRSADEAGVRLVAVSPARPDRVADAPDGLSTIPLTINLEGNYFQLVDLLRRLEDPDLAGRGLRWLSIVISESDYPVLSVQLSAQAFARIDEPLAEPSDDDEDAPDDDPAVDDGPEAPDPPPPGDEEELL